MSGQPMDRAPDAAGDGAEDPRSEHPHTGALRARRRQQGWWRGAGLAAGLVALVAVLLLAILLLVPATVSSTL